MSQSHRIYFHNHAPEFLCEIIDRSENRPITLLACSTREQFLEQLVATIRNRADGAAAPEDHHLLTRTLGLLSKSAKIKLVFCPSIESLRAYISVLDMGRVTPREGSHRPLLAVLDLLALHRTSAELTAQGLSRTLAAMVEVTSRQGVDVDLCECTNSLEGEDSLRGETLWDAKVPLANGIRPEDGILRGRLVSPKRIAQRWFKFDADG